MSGRRRRGARRRKLAVDPARFWGDPDAPLAEPPVIRPAEEPHAVVASLGAPPLPGRDEAAQAAFQLVYERASGLALALAAAAGRLEMGDADEQGDDA